MGIPFILIVLFIVMLINFTALYLPALIRTEDTVDYSDLVSIYADS